MEYDDILVKPAQSELTDDPDQEYSFAYDKSLYATDELFPAELMTVSPPIEIDEYIALLVHVCPLQYNPLKKKLIGYAKIEVTIDFFEKEGDLGEHPFPDPEGGLDGFGNLFLNPGRSIERRLSVDPPLERIPARLGKTGPELLIVYHNTFKQAAQKLELWKNMNGLPTEIVSIDSVPNYSSATNDAARVAALKTYIRKAKKTTVLGGRLVIPRLRYVLLIGDVDMIASETILDDPLSGYPWGAVNITDYYYSTKRDPASPTEMVFPWLATGRMPVRTGSEAMGVVEQIIEYEKNPPGDPEYYRRMTFAALFENKRTLSGSCTSQDSKAYMQTMEYIRERMITLGFNIERVYVTDCPNTSMDFYSDGSTVRQDVKDSVIDSATATDILISETSEGQLIIAHRDHGDKEGWHMPSFKRHDLPGITSDVPSIFFSLNCQTGWFDRPAHIESFAESLLILKGGAPSLIAATRNSHTGNNDEMMKALFDAMWGGVLPTFPSSSTASYSIKNNRLGDILNYGKSYLPIANNWSSGNKDHFEIYHVIGDPSLELWKEEPKNTGLTVKYLHHLRHGGFIAIDLTSSPKGSVITIWHKGKLLKRIEPSSTHIVLPVKDLKFPLQPPSSPRPVPVLVCFGAPGYRFHQVKVSLT